MFNFFKKKQMDIITSPVVGRSISIDKVSDKVFANRLMGDGIAFIFEGDTIYSPCGGEIIMIASTKHAFGIKTKNGTEILLHIGLDTVNLNGEGMEVLVDKTGKIKSKDPLLRINRKFMNEKGIDLTVVLVITNTQDFDLVIENPKEVNLDSIVIRTKKK